MASSRSTSSTQIWSYDVFIGFRGEDTRTNFADHLYTALHQRGIDTFNDTETLPHGVPIGETLFKAIKESRIAIVVFSKNFVSSSWCLTELEYMIRCRDEMGQIILPIFYHVDPLEVQRQQGAFDMCDWNPKLEDYNKVESWKKALAEVGNLSGWTINYNHGIPEAICIKQVVDTISNRLFPHKDINEIGIVTQDLKLRAGDSDYDVILSFHEDTRFNFVDHLYVALNQHEILTYMDTKNFLFDPSNSQFKTIEKSRIAIIIFSKNYASSSLCMEELVYIMKCRDERGLMIIPIYFDVKPWEVRRQKGDYEEVFSKHDLMNPNKSELWRKTLTDTSNLNGWEIKHIANGYEASGIQLIVKKISNILYPDKDHIGLQTRLVDIKYGGSGMNTIPPSSHEDLENLRVPLQEISSATNNFSENNIIAVGGFGKVYQGISEQHGTIAVKQLDPRHGQGEHEFMMEIALLSAYTHENIVSLVGFCDQDGEKILVLKYEVNGSLDKHIHSKNLTWIQRLRICLDVANGLKYLHEDVGAQHRILHRDIKSSNILLDENWKAKISDFGLSKVALANVPCSVIISRVCGTMGYVDPEYHGHNILTQKSDVYSFGVVLFEVLCSRLVNARQYHFSAQLAQNHYESETLDGIIDSDLSRQMNLDCLNTYSAIAYQCIKKRRDERPTMSFVVDQLEKALDYQQGSSGSWHDVYISFRHRDTECHIVDDICANLHNGNVSTYKDDGTLSRNESVLLKAIERSRLFVVVFTKKFAVNSWYLDEVVKIIESMKENRQLLLPVFLNVSRSDVRIQKGYFGDVMSEYDRHPRIEVWRNALIEATNAPGLEYSNFWSSADFVRKVVEEIKVALSAELTDVQVADNDGDKK